MYRRFFFFCFGTDADDSRGRSEVKRTRTRRENGSERRRRDGTKTLRERRRGGFGRGEYNKRVCTCVCAYQLFFRWFGGGGIERPLSSTCAITNAGEPPLRGEGAVQDRVPRETATRDRGETAKLQPRSGWKSNEIEPNTEIAKKRTGNIRCV